MQQPSATGRSVLLGLALFATTLVVMAGVASSSLAAKGQVDSGADDGISEEATHANSCLPHPPIEITERHGSAGFTWTNPVTGEREYRPTSGVVAGAGTAEDPYVIEGWCIPPNPLEFGIRIEGTSAHVVVRDTLVESGPYPVPLVRHDYGIQLQSAEHVAIENNVVTNSRYYGLHLYDVDDVAIENNTLTNHGRNAVRMAQSSHVTIENNSITANLLDDIVNWGSGIRLASSTDVTVTHNNIRHDNLALDAWSGETYDVRENWWGAASGPSGSVEDACTGEIADGDGDAIRIEHPAAGVTGSVCFDPWLTEPVETAGAS